MERPPFRRQESASSAVEARAFRRQESASDAAARAAFRRQESASAALDPSSAPRPHHGSSSLKLPPTGAVNHYNPAGTVMNPKAIGITGSGGGSVGGGGGLASGDPAVAQQWEEYYDALEADHTELRKLFDAQRAELTAAAAVLAEQRMKESIFLTLEGRVTAHEQFLNELMDMVAATGDGTTGAGLKARANINSNSSGGKAASMDAVRDALQTQQQRLQALRKSDEGNQAALRTLYAAKASPSDGPAASGVMIPASAKEMDESRARVQALERQLQAADKNRRDLSAALKKTEQAAQANTVTAEQTRGEAAELRKLLASKDDAADAADRRAKALDKELRAVQRAHEKKNDAAAVTDRTSNSVGDASRVTTRHFRLFAGRGYLDLLGADPASFEAALRDDASAAVHVPLTFITSVRVRHSGIAADPEEDDASNNDAQCGVGVDIEIKHKVSLGEAAVQLLLLECAFPAVEALRAATGPKLLAGLAADKAGLQRLVAARDAKAEAMANRCRALEAALQRRDAEVERHDRDVDAALEEAEATVKELYTALEAQRRTGAALADDLAKATGALAAVEGKAMGAEQALALARQSTTGASAQLQAAEARGKALAERCKAVEKEAAKAAALHAREMAAMTESLQAANVEVGIAVFDVAGTGGGGVRLPSADLADAVAALTLESPRSGGSNGRQTGALKAFYNVLLCEVAVATGTVPVQVARCLSTSGPSPGATPRLQLAFELAFYANPDNTAHVRADITAKLAACDFAAAMDFLRSHAESAKAAAAGAAGRRAAEQSLAEAERRLDAALTATEQRRAAGAVEKIDLLVSRLRAGEATARETRAATDARLRFLSAAEAAAAESAAALQEKVRRLEAALIEKQQQQQQHRSANTSSLNLDTAAATNSNNSSINDGGGGGDRPVRYTADVRCREQELRNKITEQAIEVRRLQSRGAALAGEAAAAQESEAAHAAALHKLQGRIKALERRGVPPQAAAAAAATATDAATASVVKGLEDSLCSAEADRAALARQVAEMETDMNDFAVIQASLQASLDSAQAELRARRLDMDALVKRLLRLEAEQQQQQQGSATTRRQSAGTLAAASGSARPSMTHDDSANRGHVSNPASETVRTPKGAANSSSSSNCDSPMASAAAAAAAGPKRIIKRSGSATAGRGFGRTASTPIININSNSPHTRGNAFPPPPAAAGAPATTTIFTRSATAVTSVRPTKGVVDAPPRLGASGAAAGAALSRQDSRSYFTTAATALKGGGSSEVTPSLTKERRHVSPVAGAASSSSRAPAGVAVSRRPPSPTQLQRGSQSNTGPSTTAANSSSGLVLTASNVRRVAPN